MNAVEIYRDYLIGEKKSRNTITAYINDICQMLDFVNKEEKEIRYLDLISWKKNISNLSSSTVARKIVSVKNYFEFLCDIEYLTENPCIKLKSVKIKNKEKNPLTSSEIRDMIDNAKNIRDKAIICFLSSTGVRVSELINIQFDDWENNIDSIVITGKGDKERTIFINEETKTYVNEYLKKRKENCNNLFVSNHGTKMEEENILNMLKLTAKKAGVKDWSRVSPHLFRTTYATLLAQNGVPVQVIQKILGHSNISTTMLYVKTDMDSVKTAMELNVF